MLNKVPDQLKLKMMLKKVPNQFFFFFWNPHSIKNFIQNVKRKIFPLSRNTVKLGYNDHGYNGYNEQNQPKRLVKHLLSKKFHAYNKQQRSNSRL